MLRAVIFDFDGVILDTEMAVYRSWCEVYEAHQQTLPLSTWLAAVGIRDGFDPYAHLEGLVKRTIDRDAIRASKGERETALCLDLGLNGGVLARLDEAQAAGLRLGVASSSDEAWVVGHLSRYGLVERFDTIVCAADDGLPGKPDPAVYLAAIERLGVTAGEAVAIEDSAYGIASAKSAGIRCIAVPNEITATMDFSQADEIVASLEEISLTALMRDWK